MLIMLQIHDFVFVESISSPPTAHVTFSSEWFYKRNPEMTERKTAMKKGHLIESGLC